MPGTGKEGGSHPIKEMKGLLLSFVNAAWHVTRPPQVTINPTFGSRTKAATAVAKLALSPFLSCML